MPLREAVAGLRRRLGELGNSDRHEDRHGGPLHATERRDDQDDRRGEHVGRQAQVQVVGERIAPRHVGRLEVARERLVVRPNRCLAAHLAARHADIVVLDVVGAGSQDSVDVGARLHREVLLDDPFHLLSRHPWTSL